MLQTFYKDQINQEQKAMTDYQYVNPYEMMYRNMNFQINQHITRQTAQKIARQLGFMHNAFGIITKDLIKILSFKFENNPTNKSPSLHPSSPKQTFQPTIPNKRTKRYPETTQIQELSDSEKRGVPLKKRVIGRDAQGKSVVVRVKDQEGGISFDQKQPRVQQPPNSDIFNEFAYDKSGAEQSKHPPKITFQDTFKEKLSKIVEEVTGKRKSKIIPESQPIPEKPQSDMLYEDNNNQEPQKILGQHVQAINPFQEFEFNPQQQKLSEQQESDKNQQSSPQPNKIRNLLQKNRPQVYEISDDEA